MTLGKRIAELRRAKGMKQVDLALEVGVKRQTVGNWETGLRAAKDEELVRIADVFGVSVDYLCGRVDAPNQMVQSQDIALPPGAWPRGAVVKIPVLGVIRAGEPLLAEENILAWREVPMDRVRDGDYFYLQVKGDSMIGARIHDGDHVLIRQQPTVENSEIAVVMVNGDEAVLKRVHRTNGQIILTSENSNYAPIVVNSPQAMVIGKVVEVVFEPR